MEFKNKINEWANEGVPPDEEREKNGFQGGYHPPAGIFNWFFCLISKCINELQSKLKQLSDTFNTFVQNNSKDLSGKANVDLSNITVPVGIPIVEATSTDGVDYTATVPNVTELYDGLMIVIRPNKTSTSTGINLNVNGLGAKPLRRPLSFGTYPSTAIDSDRLTFLQANAPCRLMYHADPPNNVNGVQGKGIWLFADKQKVSAQDLYGTTPVESGGTGGGTPEEARENLGVPSIEYVNNSFTKAETVSYVGTGYNFDAEHMSLTFSFAPTVLWIYAFENGGVVYPTASACLAGTTSGGDTIAVTGTVLQRYIMPCSELTTTEQASGCGFVQYGGTPTGQTVTPYAWKSQDGKTINWRVKIGGGGSGNAIYGSSQYNAHNTTYYVIAFEAGDGGVVNAIKNN